MTEGQELHQSSIVFDGLVVAKWGRTAFEKMHAGGLTAANCTIGIWEGVKETLVNIARFKQWFAEHSDLIMPCHTVADILEAKRSHRVGIVFGWQNTAGIEDRIDFLSLYKDLGVGFMQLTYNTQNYVGAGCWEEHDAGLSSFGVQVVREMNRVGIVIDLSHVGGRSASDAIAKSEKPCAYTHVCPAALFSHPRNKTDAQLREIIEKGGFVGIAAYAPFMRRGGDSTLDDVLDIVEHVINVCGEESVGVGTDFTEGQTEEFFDWVRRDKGSGQRIVKSYGTAPVIEEFCSLSDYPSLTAAMQRRQWPERRIRNILGENWLRFLGRVW